MKKMNKIKKIVIALMLTLSVITVSNSMSIMTVKAASNPPRPTVTSVTKVNNGTAFYATVLTDCAKTDKYCFQVIYTDSKGNYHVYYHVGATPSSGSGFRVLVNPGKKNITLRYAYVYVSKGNNVSDGCLFFL